MTQKRGSGKLPGPALLIYNVLAHCQKKIMAKICGTVNKYSEFLVYLCNDCGAFCSPSASIHH